MGEFIVWCAMMFNGVPVHAEGIVLVQGLNTYTVRFNDQIEAVNKNNCLFSKPEYGSLIPLERKR